MRLSLIDEVILESAAKILSPPSLGELRERLEQNSSYADRSLESIRVLFVGESEESRWLSARRELVYAAAELIETRRDLIYLNTDLLHLPWMLSPSMGCHAAIAAYGSMESGSLSLPRDESIEMLALLRDTVSRRCNYAERLRKWYESSWPTMVPSQYGSQDRPIRLDRISKHCVRGIVEAFLINPTLFERRPEYETKEVIVSLGMVESLRYLWQTYLGFIMEFSTIIANCMRNGEDGLFYDTRQLGMLNFSREAVVVRG